MKRYIPRATAMENRTSMVGQSLFLMAFAKFEGGVYTELTLPNSCRDAFCKYLAVSQLKRYLTASDLSSMRDPLPVNAKIALYIKNPASLTTRLKFLREIEKKLGFSKTSVTITETEVEINYQHLIFLTDTSRRQLPDNKNTVVVLNFDKRWLTNSVSLSTYLGLVRYLMNETVYKIDTRTYDQNLTAAMVSLTGNAQFGKFYIDHWHEIHNDLTINAFGININGMSVATRGSGGITVRGSLELYIGIYGYGIRRFIYFGAQRGESIGLYMGGLVRRMRQVIDEQDEKELMMGLAA